MPSSGTQRRRLLRVSENGWTNGIRRAREEAGSESASTSRSCVESRLPCSAYYREREAIACLSSLLERTCRQIVEKPGAIFCTRTRSIGAEAIALTQWLERTGAYGERSGGEVYPTGCLYTHKRETVHSFSIACLVVMAVSSSTGLGQTGISYSSVLSQACQTSPAPAVAVWHSEQTTDKQVSLWQYPHEPRMKWRFSGSQDILTFAQEIGIFGKRTTAAGRETSWRNGGKDGRKDTLPLGVWALVNAAQSRADVASGLGQGSVYPPVP